MTPDLTIAIPTYQNQDVLSKCLYSLINYTEYPFHVVVVNNDPNPESRKPLENTVAASGYDESSVIHMESNAGWMGALNRAFDESHTRYFCCMNDDVVFIPGLPDFWRLLIDPMNEYDRLGAVGPCSNYVMGAQQLFAWVPNFLFTRLLIGFCMVARSDAIEEVGGWDETLPGGDDFDISIRLRLSGWDLLIQRMAYLHHIGSLTGRKVHGNFWDSQMHQEKTDNAIIRKHGVQLWHDLISHKPIVHEEVFSVGRVSRWEDEKEWANTNFDQNGKGISVGCGENKDDAAYGLDITRPGRTGFGGLKTIGANPDIVADALDIPMVSDALDYVIASHVFEHLVNPFEALDEWHRVLKDGGVIIATMPNHKEIPSILIDASHVHAYTPESFKALIIADGRFEIVNEEVFVWAAIGFVLKKKAV